MVRVLPILVLAASLAGPSAAGRSPSTTVPQDAGPGKKPSITVRATPSMAFSPARIVATADLRGGSDSDEALYCPTVEWDWGDGTKSESALDCEPYEPGRSEIRRRYVSDHRYQYAGRYTVILRLKRGDRVVLTGRTSVTIRPGVQEYGQS